MSKTVKLEFEIPNWVACLVKKAKYQIKKLKFQLRPYRCSCCNKKMYVSNPEFEWTNIPGPVGRIYPRLIVHNISSKYSLCRECLVRELETKEWTPRFTQMEANHAALQGRAPSKFQYKYWSSKLCAVTGQKIRSFKDVEIMPYVDMTFCTSAWNHDYVSKQAVIDCVKYGDIKTCGFVYEEGKLYCINNKGLKINNKGELI